MSEQMESTEHSSDVDAILAELDAPFGVLPEKAIAAARLHRHLIIPRLIELIEKATQAVQLGRKVETNGHFFALFLLAEFRACTALPAILNALSLPAPLICSETPLRSPSEASWQHWSAIATSTYSSR